MVLVHSFWSDLQLILHTEDILMFSLRMGLRFTEQLNKLFRGDDRAQAGRGSGTEEVIADSESSFLPGHHVPAAMRDSLEGLTK